eukprot:m.63472 g.63472  ORF g.63472 m.63472 type:complete len:333 (+) comp23286_c0_seq1:363-1361(+)
MMSKLHANRPGIATVAVTMAWFFFNGCMSNINKWLFYHYNFRYPLFVTMCHQIFCWVFSGLVIHLFPKRLNVNPKPPSEQVLNRVRVLAIVFSISIACGNIALRYVFPSFTQVVASSTPISTAIAAFFIQGKMESTTSLLCIAGMCVGCALAVRGEVNFHVVGFSAIACATALRGLKSVLGSILLTGEDRLDALSLLYYTSQSASGLLLLATLAVEAVWMTSDPVVLFSSSGMWATLAVSSTVAFFMNLCNLLVTFYTSATTVSVLGNVKSVLVIVASVGIFNNEISSLSGVGTFVTLSSAAVYTQLRWDDKTRSAAPKTKTNADTKLLESV